MFLGFGFLWFGLGFGFLRFGFYLFYGLGSWVCLFVFFLIGLI